MKIGLLFGSFDPIHIGHIAIATTILNAKVVDKVLFVVAAQNPWKDRKATDFNIRCSMVHQSIQGISNVDISTDEMLIDQPSYTYKTIDAIRKKHEPNDKFFLIGGSDVINTMSKWKNFKEGISPYVEFIGVGEKLEDIDDFVDNHKVVKVEMPPILIHSTHIREMARDGKMLFPLVTMETEEIIRNHQLYKD